MEINIYNSAKLLNDTIETLSLLTPEDLDKLQDAIEEEAEQRKNQRFIELRKNAINALRDYFQAGGCIIDNNDSYSLGLDDDRLLLEDENYIYLRVA